MVIVTKILIEGKTYEQGVHGRRILLGVRLMGGGRSPGERGGWDGGLVGLHLAPALRGLGPKYTLPRPLLSEGSSGSSSMERSKRPSLEHLLPQWYPKDSPKSVSEISRLEEHSSRVPETTEGLGSDGAVLHEVTVHPPVASVPRRLSVEHLLLEQPRADRLLLTRAEELLLDRLQAEEPQLQEPDVLHSIARINEAPNAQIQHRNQVKPNPLAEVEDRHKRLASTTPPCLSCPPERSKPTTCSCCLASQRAENIDPYSPWAFTHTSKAKKRRKLKSRYLLLLASSFCLLLLALGLLYLSQTSQAMLHGVPDY